MLIVKPYDRSHALEYAARWALDRNPLFVDFTGSGGDCTSFVSQCIYAGSCVMNFTPVFGWYYVSPTDRAPAWSGVEYFYDFLVGAGDFPPNGERIGPFGRETDTAGALLGDVIQLADRDGDFYHSLLITDIRGGELYLSAHSNDARDRPLSSYNYATSRVIHIEGIYVDYPEGGCFERLLAGESTGIRQE